MYNNVHSKDQDPKVINKLHKEENKDTMNCSINESKIATLQITGEPIEIQTNSQNNSRIYL